jgi:hypothetical protein
MPLPDAPPAVVRQWDAEWLARHPGAPDVWSLLESTDSRSVFDRVDGGGLFTGTPARVSIHGSWTQVSYSIDGVDVSDRLRPGLPLLHPDLGLADEVRVLSSAVPVSERGAGPGIAIRLPTASTDWKRRADVAWTPATRRNEGLAAWDYEGLTRAHARVAGPHVAADVSTTAVRRRAPDDRVDRGRVDSLFGRFLPRGEAPGFDVAAAAQHVRGEAAPGRGTERTRHFWLRPAWTGAWRGRRIATHASWVRADSRAIEPPPATLMHERLHDGPVLDRVPAQQSTRDRLSAGARLDTDGKRWRAGVDLSHFRAASRHASGFGVAETVAGHPARLWEFSAGVPSRARLTEASAHAARAFEWFGGRLTLDAGVRADAAWTAGTSPARYRWISLAPQAGSAWHVLSRERLTAFASYTRRTIPPDARWLAYGDPGAPRADVYRWIDADADGRFTPPERAAWLKRGGPGAAVRLDPELTWPAVTEVTVGAQARCGAIWGRLSGVRRDTRDLVETVGEPLVTAVRGIPDAAADLARPEDDQLLPVYATAPSAMPLLLTNPAGHSTYHEGVVLEAGLRAGRLSVKLGGAAFRTVGDAASRGFGPLENDGGSIGERFDDPNADTFARGRLFGDRAYTLKIAGRWHAPGDVHVTAAARYQDGQPFARLVVAADLPQGPEIVRAVPNGRHRFTFTETIDIRAEKGLTLGARRVAAAVILFNVLGNRRELAENVLTGIDFREVATVQPSRALRFELGLAF